MKRRVANGDPGSWSRDLRIADFGAGGHKLLVKQIGSLEIYERQSVGKA